MINRLSNYVLNRMNNYLNKYAGGDARPVFFDIASTCPELLQVDRHYDVIKKEFDHVNQHYQLPTYHEVDSGQYEVSGKVKPQLKWKIFVLHLMGEIPDSAAELCPETCKLLESIPNLYEAFFSILDPMKPIPAHCGPYLGYIRYHLSLKVPAESPPSIRIRDQFHTWKTGESILFDDTWEHEVMNEAKEERAVLIVDILRPLPLWPHRVNSIFVRNVIRNVYAKKVIKNARIQKMDTHQHERQ